MTKLARPQDTGVTGPTVQLASQAKLKGLRRQRNVNMKAKARYDNLRAQAKTS